jgi:hypothetical protein
MFWPSNPSSVEELPVTGINRHKFSVLSRESEQALCDLVASRYAELEAKTQDDALAAHWLAELLVDAAVAVQISGAKDAPEVIIV